MSARELIEAACSTCGVAVAGTAQAAGDSYPAAVDNLVGPHVTGVWIDATGEPIEIDGVLDFDPFEPDPCPECGRRKLTVWPRA